jgi:hypothetical protein
VEEEKESKNNGTTILLLGVVSAVLTMPLFTLLYKYFPVMEIGGLRLDHILLFLAIFFATYYLLKKMRLVVYGILITGLVVLTISNFSNVYTLENLYHDYSQLLYDLSENSLRQKFLSNDTFFKKEKELREAIDYKDPAVRNYSTSIAIKHFQEDAHLSKNRKWVQYFSVFKEVYSNWVYVFDPVNEDYYSSASNTIKQLNDDGLFKGDCDDYSIMMAAAIKSIGGEVRLVRTSLVQNGQTIGHMYPEVKIGDEKDLEMVVYLLKNVFFVEEAKGKSIFYYEDSKGFIWLNFDYTDNYPGGKYMSPIRESEIII